MSIPRPVADVIENHVVLEVEGIDRMYLNVYQPGLQHGGGAASFFRFHRGEVFATARPKKRGQVSLFEGSPFLGRAADEIMTPT